jgi:tetratricopeptide (TPR) repeat protein
MSNALNKLADSLSEDILEAPDTELLAEVAEDFGSQQRLRIEFDRSLGRARRQLAITHLRRKVTSFVSTLFAFPWNVAVAVSLTVLVAFIVIPAWNSFTPGLKKTSVANNDDLNKAPLESLERFGTSLPGAVSVSREGLLKFSIAKVSEKISSNPRDIEALLGRAALYLELMEELSEKDTRKEGVASALTQATSDLTEVIRLNPGELDAYELRGHTYFSVGEFRLAANDFSQVVARMPGRTYDVLWLYLSRARVEVTSLGQPKGDPCGPGYVEVSEDKNLIYCHVIPISELETNSVKLNKKDWPFPAVDLFLGRLTPDELFAMAVSDEQRCEAHFYAGEFDLIHREFLAARESLKIAAESCPSDFDESRGAKAELGRLGGPDPALPAPR